MTGSFGRFLLVGGGVSVGYSALTAGLIALGAPAFGTTVLLYLAAVPLAFRLQHRFAFGGGPVRRGAFAIYAATQVASLMAVAAVTTQFVTRVVVVDAGLLLLTCAAAAGVSYAIARFVTFAGRG